MFSIRTVVYIIFSYTVRLSGLETVLQNFWGKTAACALERSCAIYSGNHGVISKLVCEAEEIITTTESLDSLRQKSVTPPNNGQV